MASASAGKRELSSAVIGTPGSSAPGFFRGAGVDSDEAWFTEQVDASHVAQAGRE